MRKNLKEKPKSSFLGGLFKTSDETTNTVKLKNFDMKSENVGANVRSRQSAGTRQQQQRRMSMLLPSTSRSEPVEESVYEEIHVDWGDKAQIPQENNSKNNNDDDEDDLYQTSNVQVNSSDVDDNNASEKSSIESRRIQFKNQPTVAVEVHSSFNNGRFQVSKVIANEPKQHSLNSVNHSPSNSISSVRSNGRSNAQNDGITSINNSLNTNKSILSNNHLSVDAGGKAATKKKASFDSSSHFIERHSPPLNDYHKESPSIDPSQMSVFSNSQNPLFTITDMSNVTQNGQFNTFKNKSNNNNGNRVRSKSLAASSVKSSKHDDVNS